MKTCRKCGKSYDNSWTMCLRCNAALGEGAPDVSAGDFRHFAVSVGEELAKLRGRVAALEKSAGISSPEESEGVRLAPEIAEIPGTPAAALPAGVQPGFARAARPRAEEPARDIESTIGLVWLNRIGVVALFLGAAFFLKYAFDNRWIGELGRVVLGLVAGAALFGGAEFARRKKYDVMAQGLHGAGAGILYLSIFAAFGLYKLIGVAPALAFMTLVTVYSNFWAVRTNWMSAAVIGTAGGFLTLAIIGTRNLAPVSFFGYMALLDIGVLAVSLYREWRVLNLASFALSHLLFGAWLSSSVSTHRVEAAVFAAILFAVYCVLSIAHNLVRGKKSDGVDVSLVLMNGIAVFAELLTILKPYAGPFPGLLPLAFASVYLAYSVSALKRAADDKSLVLSYVGMALSFVTLVMPVQFNGHWTTAAWAAESLLLFWLSFRTSIPKLRLWAIGVGFLSLLSLWSKTVFASNFDSRFLLNQDMLAYVLVAGATFGAAALYAVHKPAVSKSERHVFSILIVLANLLLLYRFSVEIGIYFDQIARAKAMLVSAPGKPEWYAAFHKTSRGLFGATQMTLSALWIFYALASVACGIYRRSRTLRLFGLVLFGAAVLKIFLIDLSQLDRIYRIGSFMVLGFVLLVTSFFYQRYKDRIKTFALGE